MRVYSIGRSLISIHLAQSRAEEFAIESFVEHCLSRTRRRMPKHIVCTCLARVEGRRVPPRTATLVMRRALVVVGPSPRPPAAPNQRRPRTRTCATLYLCYPAHIRKHSTYTPISSTPQPCTADPNGCLAPHGFPDTGATLSVGELLRLER